MSRWYDAIPGVTGKMPLSDATLSAWPDRAMEGRLHHLSFCPVALTEVYAVAQQIALTIIDSPAGPELVADLRADRLLRPAFAADGKWVLAYRPNVLRMLPFFVENDGSIWRIDDANGEPSPDRPLDLQKRLCSILGAQVSGRLKLRESLTYLIENEFLEPVENPADPAIPEWQVVSRAMSGSRICEDFLAMRLLHAMVFSTQHLKTRAPLQDQTVIARLSLARDDLMRKRPFLMESDTIDFDKLLGERPATGGPVT